MQKRIRIILLALLAVFGLSVIVVQSQITDPTSSASNASNSNPLLVDPPPPLVQIDGRTSGGLGLYAINLEACEACVPYQADKKLFDNRCMRCHSLARVINAPYYDDQWYMIVARMLRKRNIGTTLEEGRRIASFLKFYSKKVANEPQLFPNVMVKILWDYRDFPLSNDSFNFLPETQPQRLSLRWVVYQMLDKYGNLASKMGYKPLPKRKLSDKDLLSIFAYVTRDQGIQQTFFQKLEQHPGYAVILQAYKAAQGNSTEGKGVEDVLRESKLTASGNGAALYARYCASCHGQQGHGNIGPMLNHPWLLNVFINNSPELYAKTLEYGRPGTLMASYIHKNYGIFNTNQIENIIHFFEERWYKQYNFAPLELPIYPLQHESTEEEGKQLFSNLCIRCHGNRGEGGIGPAIRNYFFIGYEDYLPSNAQQHHDLREMDPLTITNQALRAIIKTGRNDMPGFGSSEMDDPTMISLEDIQVDSIIRFLRNNPIRVPKY